MSRPPDLAPAQLKRELRRAKRRQQILALALIAPLLVFLLVTFVVPIGVLLKRAIDNPEVADSLPRTVQALTDWDRQDLPPDAAFAALALDLAEAKGQPHAGVLARRLNSAWPGARSLVQKTVRAMPLLDGQGLALPADRVRAALTGIDPRWAEVGIWRALAMNASRHSDVYLLAAMDLERVHDGTLVTKPEGESAYRQIFGRTFVIAGVVTLACLVLAFPLACWLAHLPERQAHLVLVLVLIPFWTSVLVRVAAWIVLLQTEGLVNGALVSLGLARGPQELLFNRLGVYISMTHILLPFMILPLYSVMRAIPASYLRAAVSLGSHPFAAFWRVYVPQTYPGVAAGALLVFILALGYYITPALLGGPGDQMVSYYVAYFTNVAINWGMASALGVLLLAATLLLFAVYRRFARLDLAL